MRFDETLISQEFKHIIVSHENLDTNDKFLVIHGTRRISLSEIEVHGHKEEEIRV